MEKWKCKKSELVFDEKYFKVRKDTVELPNKETKEWIYWDSQDSAMMIALNNDRKLVMIRQYRYLVNDMVLEFRSGGLLKEENPEDGARRELGEETGYKCGRLYKLGAFYETYGQLNRRIHLFFSSDIKKSEQKPDKGEDGFEDVEVEFIDYEKAIELALANKIVAMGSSLAILLLKAKIEKGLVKIK